MIWSIAWRNIWRNKIRSLVVIMAVAIGMFGGTFSVGLMNGLIKDRINEAVNNESSHIQLHNPHFLENNELIHIIEEAENIASEIEKLPAVEAVSIRYKLLNSAQTEHNSTGVVLYSVNPEKEKMVSGISEKIDTGEYFTSLKSPQIVISRKISEKLRAKVGDEIAINLTKPDTSSIKVNFTIVGIYKTHNGMFDGRTVFTRTSDLENLIGLNSSNAHEIIVRLKNHKTLHETVETLEETYKNLDVQSWIKILPDVGMLVEMGDFMLFVIILIILLALSFGIINTMMMSVMERRKELGMLLAVGMSKKRVFTMIMLETIFLSIVGAVIGTLFAAVIVFVTGNSGINFESFSEGFEQVGYASVMYPELAWYEYVEIIGLVIFVAVAACIYPARKALKLRPVEAIKDYN
ncbi:MAG: ABC transporter permease [Bacteroidales bacterium]|nr:ABC transporter permease [Bacteroidales bacterium]